MHLISRLANVLKSPSCLQGRQHGMVGSSGLLLFINKALLFSLVLDYMAIVSKTPRSCFLFVLVVHCPIKRWNMPIDMLLKVKKAYHLSANIFCSFAPAYLGLHRWRLIGRPFYPFHSGHPILLFLNWNTEIYFPSKL